MIHREGAVDGKVDFKVISWFLPHHIPSTPDDIKLSQQNILRVSTDLSPIGRFIVTKRATAHFFLFKCRKCG